MTRHSAATPRPGGDQRDALRTLRWLALRVRVSAFGFALLVLLAPGRAPAEPVWIGPFAGVPGDGSGAPIRDRHVPAGLTARRPLAWQPALGPVELATSVTGGVGIPIASIGVSAWSGLELRLPVASRIALTLTPGVRTGFVGPGYYARRSHVFVGNDYIHAGPWTVAPRLPVGATLAITDRVEAFLEALAELPVSPGPELLLGGALGMRVRL